MSAAATASFDALVRAFEDGTLPPAQFSHRLHLSFGWHYLQRHGFPAGASLFCARLRAYVAAVGAEGKYHETITWAYLALMNEERVLHATPGESFEELVQRRPDLLDHRNGALAACYPPGQLSCESARRSSCCRESPPAGDAGSGSSLRLRAGMSSFKKSGRL